MFDYHEILSGSEVVVLGLIAWGLQKLVSTILDLIVRMKSLDENMAKLLKMYERVPELERDIKRLGTSVREQFSKLKGDT